MPSVAFGFEPLNKDDAGTVKAGGNQIEQYFFAINRHPGNLQSNITTPGEEYTGINDARAFPFTYTQGLTEEIEALFSPQRTTPNLAEVIHDFQFIYLQANSDFMKMRKWDTLLQSNQR